MLLQLVEARVVWRGGFETCRVRLPASLPALGSTLRVYHFNDSGMKDVAGPRVRDCIKRHGLPTATVTLGKSTLRRLLRTCSQSREAMVRGSLWYIRYAQVAATI